MNYKLIVPPSYETAITGFTMAAEKQFGRTCYRLEYWRGEGFPRVFRNGKALASVAICPPSIRAVWAHMRDRLAANQRAA